MSQLEWVKTCLLCNTINHLHSHDGERRFAWECHACLNSFWIDDNHRTMYAQQNDITGSQADHLLKNNQVKVYHGQ
jgi:hypothetical protein